MGVDDVAIKDIEEIVRQCQNHYQSVKFRLTYHVSTASTAIALSSFSSLTALVLLTNCDSDQSPGQITNDVQVFTRRLRSNCRTGPKRSQTPEPVLSTLRLDSG